MLQFTGTKTVTAMPMTRADYNTYREWDLPADEDGADDGYLVEYLDGGKANHKDHTGYISWSPKEQFDNSYVESGTAKQRVASELGELGRKATALNEYKGSDAYKKLPKNDQRLLRIQLQAMLQYGETLNLRLEGWVD